MYKIKNIAQYFIYEKEEEDPNKIMILCFYSYCWGLALKKDIFKAKFEAWVHLPTNIELRGILYEGWDLNYNILDDYNDKLLDSDTINFLNMIWNTYGEYDRHQLESIVHQESPYIKARKGYQLFDACNIIIEDEDIIEEFRYRDLRYSFKLIRNYNDVVESILKNFKGDELIKIINKLKKDLTS